MFDKARRAIDLGANGLLVTYSAGLASLRELTSHPDITVPVMLHASHMIAMMKQIAWPVLAKLCRLCGADLMLTPTMWSSIPMVSMEEGLRTSFVKLAPWGHIKRTFPMPCAGVYPGVAEVIIGEYGPDIVIPAGGGMLGHPDGYTAGAQSWQQAIAAVMAGVPLPEAARKPENKALRHALEKWGYMERPKTPWLPAGAGVSTQADEVRVEDGPDSGLRSPEVGLPMPLARLPIFQIRMSTKSQGTSKGQTWPFQSECPDIGTTVDHVKLVRWLKQEGERSNVASRSARWRPTRRSANSNRLRKACC